MNQSLPSTAQFWSEVFPAQEPVVWRGGAGHLELVQLARRGPRELARALTARAGARTVRVTAAPPSVGGKLGYTIDTFADWSAYSTTMAQLLSDLIQESERPTGLCLYMQAMPVGSGLPELAALLPPWFHDGERMKDESTQLWIGGGGQRVAIHQDSTHGILGMVAGTKEITLYPPDQHFNLYTSPQKELFKHPWRSVVDPTEPDLERFPRFAQAMVASRTIHLEPGDVLFIPAGWWHAVHSRGFNVMFNTRWCDVDAPTIDDATRAFVHAFLAARPLEPAVLDELRRELAQHAFARPRRALSPEERARWLRRLHASSPARGVELGWEEPIGLATDVRCSFRAGGAQLSSGATSHRKSHALPWDFMPLLKTFGETTSARAALEALRHEFDVDAEVFLAHVRALVACEVLVPASAPQRRALSTETALAHVVLATADLPAHLRELIRIWIDAFALRVHGDPYPHLPVEQHGMFAATPSDATASTMREIVRTGIDLRHGVPEFFWSTPYALRDDARCSIAGGVLRYADPGSGETRKLPWDHAEVLASFRTPSTPERVFETVRETWSTTPEAFRELTVGWIRAGLLVPESA